MIRILQYHIDHANNDNEDDRECRWWWLQLCCHLTFPPDITMTTTTATAIATSKQTTHRWLILLCDIDADTDTDGDDECVVECRYWMSIWMLDLFVTIVCRTLYYLWVLSEYNRYVFPLPIVSFCWLYSFHYLLSCFVLWLWMVIIDNHWLIDWLTVWPIDWLCCYRLQ